MSYTSKPDLAELELVPVQRSQTIPADWYSATQSLAWEQESIFSSTWQYVASVSQLSTPGDQVPIQMGHVPVLLVNDDGQLRAFVNVCKHRGGPIATEQCRENYLKCAYHGWVYRLDGSLRGVPQFKYAELFDKADFGLTELKIERFGSLLFVCAGEPVVAFLEWVKGISEQIAPFSLDSYRFKERVSYTISCNWKVYVDNYLEGYHIPHVHPELCDLISYTQYKTELFSWYSLQHSPVKATDSIYSTENGQAYYYHLFPNTMLNILSNRMQVNVVYPISVDSCIVHFDYYYGNMNETEENAFFNEDKEFSERVQQEDIEICEHVQRGLSSGFYNKGRFSVECETGVHHFQSLLKQLFTNYFYGS